MHQNTPPRSIHVVTSSPSIPQPAMSSFLSTPHDHHHPADLLDEYWFFSNTLNNNDKKPPPPPLPTTRQPSSTTKPQPQPQGSGCRRRSLLRTPSLPPPRMLAEEQADDDDLNWSSIYEGILRTRTTAAAQQVTSSRRSSSALQRAPSMPVVPSSSEGGQNRKDKAMPNNTNKLRHSNSTLERHTNTKQQRSKQPVTMMTQLSADEKKKYWKSSSDLESIEVQGFKDLGFVFDKEELREDLADVLPGLNKNACSGHDDVRRPYLSEAWHHDRRRPALIRVRSEARSAAEMKDQLRTWAQAVACNVRQECA